MRKLVVLFFPVLLQAGVCAQETNIFNSPTPFEAGKYTVIKTTHNYSPLREGADINAKRAAHLTKGARLYADSDVDNFYRIDLGLDKYYWIEKKYVNVESVCDKKALLAIKNIELIEGDNYYAVKIETPVLTAYNEIETSPYSLDFILYDVFVDKENLQIKGKNRGDFKISKDEFDNLKISYVSNYPLTGHEVAYFENGILLKVKKPFKLGRKKPLSNLVFAIDPGHGGDEPGACANGLKEKDINLQISKILAQELKKEGAKVYLTRESDINPDLYDRVDFAKEKGADFLFSIHQNSLANPAKVNEKHGVGMYYYNKEAYKLSEEIQYALVSGTGFRDDGVNLASFALTRAANPLCVLIECGYIIHPREAAKLSEKSFQRAVSASITRGVKNYLKKNYTSYHDRQELLVRF